jgi:two-component system response regulator ResD
MQQVKILLADDETALREVVCLYLEREGFKVFQATDGEQALLLEEKESPDLLLLDVMMPKLSGWEVARSISRRVPIIFLTARGLEDDKMTGFNLGADDYLTKPFSPRELVARVRAVLRRCGLLPGDGSMIRFRGVLIDPSGRSLQIDGAPVTLSPKEFDILVFFARHPGIVFSREQLLNNIWGYDFEGDERTVDATIKRLRAKLGPIQDYIQTAWGSGYKFEALK